MWEIFSDCTGCDAHFWDLDSRGIGIGEIVCSLVRIMTAAGWAFAASALSKPWRLSTFQKDHTLGLQEAARTYRSGWLLGGAQR